MAYNDLLRLVAQAESGNRDYDAAGRVVTSPVGAKGRMQVMDATNRDPGYGVAPARDDSLEERARVGQDYLAAMVSHYGGDVRKGLAAYNAGPGNVDRALARAQQAGESDWMRYLPKPEETVPYVEKIVAGMRGQPGTLDRVAAAVLPSANAAGAPEVDWNTVTWDAPATQPAATLAKPDDVDWSTVQWDGADTPARSPDGALRIEMSQESNPAAAEPSAGPTQAQKIQGSAFGRMAQGAVVDPLNAGAQLLVNAAPGGVVGAVNSATQYVNELPVVGPITRALGMTPATAQDVNQGVQQQEQQYQAARQATGNTGFDWARLSGNVAATAPLAAAMAPAAGLSVPASIATAAGSGAVFGGLQPVTEQGDYAENKLRQMAVGGAAGGVLSGVGNAVARVISPRASVNPNVQTLLDEGVTPTPGQLLGGTAQRVEDKAVSVPILGDAIRSARERGVQEFNEAALNRAVAPLGQQVTATGREGMQQVQRIVGDAYDDILPRLNFRADNQFAQEIGTLQQMAQTLPPGQAQQFETILRDQVIGRLTRQGGATGQNYRAIESELGRLGANYRSSAVAGERELGMAITELQSSLREALTRSNPQVAQELASINQAYSMLTRLQRAAGATGANEGVFTPAQFAAAVRAADGTVRKNAYARGDALMQDLSDAGRSVMNTTVPNSGTFDRAALVGTAGVSAANPLFPVGLAAGALPYLSGPNRLAASLIARRPDIAPQLAERISGILPAAGVVAAPALNQLLQP